MSIVHLGTIKAGVGQSGTVKVDDKLQVNGEATFNQPTTHVGDTTFTGDVELNTERGLPMFACRAWALYNGVADTITESGNFSSITRIATGYHEFEFTVAMPDVNYSIVVSPVSIATSGTGGLHRIENGFKSTTGFRLVNTNTSGAAHNMSHISVAVFR